MAEKARLEIEIGTKGSESITQVNTQLGALDNQAKKIGGSFNLMGTLITAAIGGALVSAAKKCIDAFAESEKNLAQLNQAMINAGTYSKGASDSLVNYAKSLQNVTTFEDDAIVKAEAIFMQYGLNVETTKKLTKATLDLAAAKGMDLASAADLVAKSVGSSTNALQRYGVEVTGVQGSAERATTAVENMSRLFGGQAEAQAKTLAGAMEQLKNKFGDFAEDIGKSLAPTANIIVAVLSALMDVFSTFFGYVEEEWGNIFAWMAGTARAGLEYIGNVFTAVFNGIGERFKIIFDDMGQYLQAAIMLMQGNVFGAWDAFKAAQQANSEELTTNWQETIANLEMANDTLTQNAKINWEGINSTINNALNKIKNAIKSSNQQIIADTSATSATQNNIWDKVFEHRKELETGFSSFRSNVSSALNSDFIRSSKTAFATFKALAVASATVATYQAATSAYAALAPIPFVGPVLGIAASVAAIASGLANVYAIAHTELPAAEFGGIIPGSASGMPVLAGERGKSEAIIPLEGEGASRLQDAMGGGQTIINVNVETLVAENDMAVRRIGEIIDQELENRRYRKSSVFATGLKTELAFG